MLKIKLRQFLLIVLTAGAFEATAVAAGKPGKRVVSGRLDAVYKNIYSSKAELQENKELLFKAFIRAVNQDNIRLVSILLDWGVNVKSGSKAIRALLPSSMNNGMDLIRSRKWDIMTKVTEKRLQNINAMPLNSLHGKSSEIKKEFLKRAGLLLSPYKYVEGVKRGAGSPFEDAVICLKQGNSETDYNRIAIRRVVNYYWGGLKIRSAKNSRMVMTIPKKDITGFTFLNPLTPRELNTNMARLKTLKKLIDTSAVKRQIEILTVAVQHLNVRKREMEKLIRIVSSDCCVFDNQLMTVAERDKIKSARESAARKIEFEKIKREKAIEAEKQQALLEDHKRFDRQIENKFIKMSGVMKKISM
ncbi:MAG: hypothetical protein ACYTFY_07225 [Planctomycetota bacterium]|jgi:hypothetical protein